MDKMEDIEIEKKKDIEVSELSERLSNLEKSERYKKIFSNVGDSSPDFSETETMLKNLKVLSTVKIGQKLYVNQNVISTEHVYLRKISEGLKLSDVEEAEKEEVDSKIDSRIDSRFGINSVLRWYLNESRTKTLEKIRSIIKDAVICGYLAMESHDVSFSSGRVKYKTINDLNNLLYIKRWEIVRSAVIAKTNKEVLVELVSLFTKLLPGLGNIRITYNDDIEFASLLDIEIDIVRSTIEEFERFIHEIDNTI